MNRKILLGTIVCGVALIAGGIAFFFNRVKEPIETLSSFEDDLDDDEIEIPRIEEVDDDKKLDLDVKNTGKNDGPIVIKIEVEDD